jgi:hypothetical protein
MTGRTTSATKNKDPKPTGNDSSNARTPLVERERTKNRRSRDQELRRQDQEHQKLLIS